MDLSDFMVVDGSGDQIKHDDMKSKIMVHRDYARHLVTIQILGSGNRYFLAKDKLKTEYKISEKSRIVFCG